MGYVLIVDGQMSYGIPLAGIGEITSNRRCLVDPKNVTLVMFTGGEDVDPSYYGAKTRHLSGYNTARDIDEKNIFDYCLENGIKMTGICRGFQFLNVMCGGFMHQDIDNHGVFRHGVMFPNLDEIVKASSTHHQLVGLPNNAIPVAWASPNRITRCHGRDGEFMPPPTREIESAIFPDYNAMGVQFHPEFMDNDEPGRILYERMVRDFVNMPMIDFIGKYGYMEELKNVGRKDLARAGGVAVN